MKYTTIVAAGLAAGVSADDWQSWATTVTSVSCPSKVTQTITKTTDCAEVTSEVYKTTITVEAPKTKTVTIYSDGKTAKNFWEEWVYTPAPAGPTSLPHGCVPQVVTETEYAYVKKAGSTTTITKSTLWVGVGEYTAPTTITITEKGAAPTPVWQAGNYGPGYDSGYGSGPDSSGGYDQGSNGYQGSGDNGNGAVWDGWNDGKGPEYTTLANGWKLPVSDKLVGTDLWKLPPQIPTNTKSYTAPEYTQKPDGSYGYEWGSWEGWDGSNGNKPNGPNGPGDKPNGPGVGPTKNITTTPYNITAGAPGSNVTAPFLPLKENSCNSPGSRGQWCGGKSASTNYYQDYPSGGLCTADFTVSEKTLDLEGIKKPYLAINGQVPGPLLECNWGDTIQVTIHNQMSSATSFHWHGFQQLGTNDQDGVPGVTECPIAPGGSKTYTFKATSYGTTWYHSHAMAQYGDGAYGPIIIHGPATADYDADMGVVAISDTFNGTAAQQNDYITRHGPLNTHNYLLNGHNVQYDLSAGQHSLWEVEKGKKYLFRFLNAAAQNMFSVSIDNHKMKVIAADFVPIQPYETQWLNIGIGQRYDTVVTMDQAVDSYFLRAVTQTQCPSGCDNTGLGNANGIIAYKGVKTMPYYLPTSTTSKTIEDFAICDDEPLHSLTPFVNMGAGSSSAFAASASTLPASAPAAIDTTDDGRVFKWFLNNGAINVNFTQPTLKTLAEKGAMNNTLISNPVILKKQNEWVYFVIQNHFFAAHPIHLHGHDFSILGQGFGDFDVKSQLGELNFNNPMRRDTAMLKGAVPGPYTSTGYTVIGFKTDNPGAWLMHCHIIWHVDGGLALQWIERPDDIATSKALPSGLKDQCSAYSQYEHSHPGAKKLSGDSGLKKRSFFDEQMSRVSGLQSNDVVRRSDSMKHYLDTRAKRVFGDGSHSRHFARK